MKVEIPFPGKAVPYSVVGTRVVNQIIEYRGKLLMLTDNAAVWDITDLDNITLVFGVACENR